MLVIILIMITNLRPPNQQAPKRRFEGVLNARGLVQRQSGSSKDISNIDLIKYYKSDVNLILLNKILHLNIFRSII